MPKESLKDRLDGNELDLSLSDLSTVPVKELMALKKATNIDLSCNLLVTLPADFCSLTHIVRLDLSKNRLTELPARFGSLERLQHLDLLGNQLTTLPVDMNRLRSLRWMDVKDNPLDENLKKVVGDCLDENQCRQSAKNIVAHMKTVASDLERENQKHLKQKRDLEEKKKREEEKERQRQKVERKAEREKRKKDYEAAQAEKRKATALKEQQEQEKESTTNGVSASPKQPSKASGGISCCGLLFAFFIVVIAVSIGAFFFCEQNQKIIMCQETKTQVLRYYTLAKNHIDQYLKKT